MIDSRRLAFDIDGVVANTMQLFLDILNDVYGINHITPVLFSQPWNRRLHPFMEVGSWNQLEELIQWT